jgi:hypothetical protein
MSVFKRMLATLLLAAYGFATGALIGAALTFYVYFIGAWLGAPIGAVWAEYVGFRTPLRDSTLLFCGALCGLHLSRWLVGALTNWGSFGVSAMACGGFVLAGALLYLSARDYLSLRTRFEFALPLAAFWSVYFLAMIYQRLYVWQP